MAPWGAATGWQQPMATPGVNPVPAVPNILQSTGSFSPQFGEPAVHLPLPELPEAAMAAEEAAVPKLPVATLPTSLSPEVPVDSFVSEKPAAVKPASEDNDRAAMYIFRAVKLGLGGAVIAALTSKFSNVKFSKVFMVELLTGVTELVMTQKILNAKGPLTQKIMEVSNRLVHGPDKPVKDMTPSEKHHSFVPISTLVTVLSGFVSGAYSLYARETIDFTKEQKRLESLKALSKDAMPFLEKLKTQAEILGREALKLGPVDYLRKNPKFIIPISVTAAGLYGFAEGEAAQYLIKLYKKWTGQSVDPDLLVD